jgi:hypothetical protein
MSPDLEVDIAAVHAAAESVDDLAARVTAGAAESPRPVPVPRWATSDAAEEAADAVRRELAAVGWAIGATAREIIATILDYDAADERAAARLRSAR